MSQAKILTHSLRAHVSPAEWQARVELAAAHRFMVRQGWQEPYGLYNHLSARVPDDRDCFLLKPHDVLFNEVTASNLIKLNVNEPKGFKDNVNSAGFAIHAAVMNGRADLNAAMHLHTADGMAVGALERKLMFVTQESLAFYNRVGYHEFEGIARLDERERIVRDLGIQNHTLILRNHGLLTCGVSIASAAMRMSQIIQLAEVQLRVLSTGEPYKEPAPDICEETAAMFDKIYDKEMVTNWAAVMRWLDTIDSSYRS